MLPARRQQRSRPEPHRRHRHHRHRRRQSACTLARPPAAPAAKQEDICFEKQILMSICGIVPVPPPAAAPAPPPPPPPTQRRARAVMRAFRARPSNCGHGTRKVSGRVHVELYVTWRAQTTTRTFSYSRIWSAVVAAGMRRRRAARGTAARRNMLMRVCGVVVDVEGRVCVGENGPLFVYVELQPKPE